MEARRYDNGWEGREEGKVWEDWVIDIISWSNLTNEYNYDILPIASFFNGCVYSMAKHIICYHQFWYGHPGIRSLNLILTTRMWATAQRDGHPAEYSGALCSTPQSLADAHYQNTMQ